MPGQHARCTTVDDAIEVSGLRYTYPGARTPAVDGMDFTVRTGEIFGLLGPSGAGKSTTQRVLTGLLAGFEGQASVLGRPVSAWGSSLYERIGVGFEQPNHFTKLTAAENLGFFAALHPRSRDPLTLLEALGLADVADDRVSSFSKGMAMRLNFARALLADPELLFLDEPTSGLDPVHARRLGALIAAERDRGCTVVLATHDMTVADELCDRVAFVVDGRLAALDDPLALKLRAGRRRVRVGLRVDGASNEEEFDLARLAEDARFLELLRSGNVETIHTTEATLADVFVAVTGQSLR